MHCRVARRSVYNLPPGTRIKKQAGLPLPFIIVDDICFFLPILIYSLKLFSGVAERYKGDYLYLGRYTKDAPYLFRVYRGYPAGTKPPVA